MTSREEEGKKCSLRRWKIPTSIVSIITQKSPTNKQCSIVVAKGCPWTVLPIMWDGEWEEYNTCFKSHICQSINKFKLAQTYQLSHGFHHCYYVTYFSSFNECGFLKLIHALIEQFGCVCNDERPNLGYDDGESIWAITISSWWRHWFDR